LYIEDRSKLTVKKYARVSNASRSDWSEWKRFKKPAGSAANGLDAKEKFTGSVWLDVSRDVHKAACGSDRNELISAAVHANLYKRKK
jgi:hypothetical protein